MRFLSEVGGGRVAGFQGKDIVLVEDEDGFQVPTSISDVVVVDNDDYSTRRVVENKMKQVEADTACGGAQRRRQAQCIPGFCAYGLEGHYFDAL